MVPREHQPHSGAAAHAAHDVYVAQRAVPLSARAAKKAQVQPKRQGPDNPTGPPFAARGSVCVHASVTGAAARVGLKVGVALAKGKVRKVEVAADARRRRGAPETVLVDAVGARRHLRARRDGRGARRHPRVLRHDGARRAGHLGAGARARGCRGTCGGPDTCVSPLQLLPLFLGLRSKCHVLRHHPQPERLVQVAHEVDDWQRSGQAIADDALVVHTAPLVALDRHDCELRHHWHPLAVSAAQPVHVASDDAVSGQAARRRAQRTRAFSKRLVSV